MTTQTAQQKIVPATQHGQGAAPTSQQSQDPALDLAENSSQSSGAIFTLLPDESRTGGSQAQASQTTTIAKDAEEPEQMACSIREMPLSRWDDEKKSTELTPERILGRNITQTEQAAIQQAHGVGSAWKQNYGFLDLREKVDILIAGGFSKEERRALMESGLVGTSKTSPTQQSIPIEERRSLQRIIALKDEYASLIDDVDFGSMNQETFEKVMDKYTEWFAKAMRALWIFVKIAQEKDDFEKIEPIQGMAKDIILHYQGLISRKTESDKELEKKQQKHLRFTPKHSILFAEATNYWARLKEK